MTNGQRQLCQFAICNSILVCKAKKKRETREMSRTQVTHLSLDCKAIQE